MFFCADRQKVFAVFLFSGFLLLGGCGRQEKAEGLFEDREVASVNDYKIIVSDFKTAVNPVLEYEKVGESDWVAKDAILDNLITKKLLIMEAQNQGLDRDRVFMKEVERFWEQSLVKLLLKRKADEFVKTFSITDEDIRREYQRRSYRLFAELVSVDDENAARALSAAGADFEKIKASLARPVLLDVPAQWWWSGDRLYYLEDFMEDYEDEMFSLKAGEVSRPFAYKGRWYILRVLNTESVDQGPLESVAQEIRSDLLEEEYEEAYEEWLEGLRKKVVIKTNSDILEKLDLKALRGR